MTANSAVNLAFNNVEVPTANVGVPVPPGSVFKVSYIKSKGLLVYSLSSLYPVTSEWAVRPFSYR